MNTLYTVRLAHELRNLLTIMGRRVQSIREHTFVQVVGSVDADVADLDHAINSAFEITRELLALALGRSDISTPSIIDVNEVVDQAKGFLQRLLGTGIGLTLRLAAVDPIIEADAVLLEWLLLNVVANARDAMLDGGTITIATDVGSAPPGDTDAPSGPHVHLMVTDTGHGIVPSVLETIFEPFATTRSGRLGLGLTSVAITVRMLKGRMLVHSETSVGTTVHVYLPIFG